MVKRLTRTEWELIDEENAEGEHEDFDFEYNLQKLELARTGRAMPNAKSEQDGVSTQEHKPGTEFDMCTQEKKHLMQELTRVVKAEHFASQ